MVHYGSSSGGYSRAVVEVVGAFVIESEATAVDPAPHTVSARPTTVALAISVAIERALASTPSAMANPSSPPPGFSVPRPSRLEAMTSGPAHRHNMRDLLTGR